MDTLVRVFNVISSNTARESKLTSSNLLSFGILKTSFRLPSLSRSFPSQYYY